MAALLLAGLSAAAVFWFYSGGYLNYYGDAEAHLNIARRVVDSRTPGYDQLGSVWLPLLHVLLLPLVRYDGLWHSGLAGSIPSAAAFVLGGVFLFAAVRRIFGGGAPAWVAIALYALNPNLLYLQSTAMTEPLFLGCLMAILYFTVVFRQTESRIALVCAALANAAATLTRYEGWFLVPFVTAYILIASRRNRVAAAVLYGAVASLGAAYWLAHNRYLFGDALFFFNGPYSARAIQGNKPYPGLHDWPAALLYFRTAARLCVGTPLFWMGLAGAVVAAFRRAFWPLLLVSLPAAFYVWSVHSSGTPIFVPGLWPNSHYNTRYGLALLPLLVLGGAALATLAPQGRRHWAAVVIVLAAVSPWLLQPRKESWVTWKESQVNSEGRRAWTREAAGYLGPRYRPGAGIYTGFGDLTGIYRAMRVPLRVTLTGDNEPQFMASYARPDLFLREEWAVCMAGDPVQTVLTRARRPYPDYPTYTLVKRIVVKGAPVIEIWRRFTPAESQ